MTQRRVRAAVLALACALLAPAALAADTGVPTAALREQARQATDRRDWPSALAGYGVLVERHPDDVDLLVEAARVQGFADRNAAAVALYRRAIALAPQRRAALLPSLAWQTLWSGAAGEAQALFTEWLGVAQGAARVEALDGLGQARQAGGDQAGALQAFTQAHQLSPAERRLHRRYAMSLLWNGQEARAIDELQQLLAAAPDDRDLGWALANARNFHGQHRQALREFQRWPAPVHPGERADLARAWRWAGYEDRAWPLLADPTDADSAWLRDWRVRRERVPFGYVTVERAEDRDRLVADAVVVGAGWHPTPGATAELQARHVSMDDAFGQPRARQLQAVWRWRLGEPQSAWGTVWPTVALRVMQVGDWQPLAPTARVTWVPDDGWRVDAEASRELVEAPRALANRVHVDVLSAGVEQRPDPLWLWSVSAARLRFDDGTTRARAGARLERRVWARPRIALGLEASAIEKLSGPVNVDRGYWNPRRYAELRAYGALSHEFRPFELQFKLGLGTAREVDDAGNTNRGRPNLWELGLAWDAAQSLRLRLAAGGTGQSLGLGTGTGGAGYWRRYLNLSANVWF